MSTLLARAMLGFLSIRARLTSERGQGLLEYGILVGLLAVAIAGAAALLQDDIESMFTGIGDCIDFDSASACP